MKITIIHGQGHKGITYTMTKTLVDKLMGESDELREFFLPKDGSDFCVGCSNCFMKGEEFCPSAEKVQPIAKAIEWADVVILDSPLYVMEMSGALKNLMDHLAYRWVTHRPHGSMFLKTGVVVCSSAGAPTGGALKSMASQLKWLCVPKVYCFGLTAMAPGFADLSDKKKSEIARRSEKIAKAVKRRYIKPRPCLRGRLMFKIFSGMQAADDAAWNPTDRDWWRNQGWTEKVRPWKK